MDKKYIFIYDTKQANFFYQEGVKLVEIGKGNRGDSYLKFIRDDMAEQTLTKWKEDEENIKNNMYG